MTIKKMLYGGPDTTGASDLLSKVREAQKQVGIDNNLLAESKYQGDLRRTTQKLLTGNKTSKEPNVVYRGYDTEQGSHIAEDVNTGRRFQAEPLSNGPLKKDERVMGFPPKPGQSKGYIRGPMKGPEIPPIEGGKKKKKPPVIEPRKDVEYILEIEVVCE